MTQQQNQLAVTQPPGKPSALAVMASRFSVEPTKLLDTLKATVFKGANDAQLMSLVLVANEYGLNPLTKQLYAFPGKGGEVVPVVSVDGWIKLMNDNPNFNGIEFETEDVDGKPHSVTAVIHVKGREKPVRVTEYFSECKRNTDPWNTAPRRMLRHKALIQGVRVAFGLSGIYDPEEAELIAAKPAKAHVVQLAPEPQPAEVVVVEEQRPKRKIKTTPLGTLKDLMLGSKVSEGSLLAALQPASGAESLDDLAEAEIANAIANWELILAEVNK